MSNITNIGDRAQSLEKSNLYKPYSKVILNVADDISYTAGDDTGRTMEVTCPYGTAEMANRILSKIRGYKYQPYKASGAVLDPAAEIGDGVFVGGIFGGLYSKGISFGPMYTADVSSPGEEKINYQYAYKSPEQRKITRNFKNVRAEFKVQSTLISAEVEARKSDVDKINAMLKVQADNIEAKVSKTGGDNSSFGWKLLSDSWSIFANGATVFKITKDVAEFAGKIISKSGEIGGLSISANSLSSNGKTWGGSGSGVYIGPNGLLLGNGFKVDSAGNLTASSGTFSGKVHAGSIQYGGSAGYFSGGGLSNRSVGGGKVEANTITTTNTSGGINTSLGYADYAYGCTQGWQKFGSMTGSYLGASNISLGGNALSLKETYVQDQNGEVKYIRYVAWTSV